VTTCAQPGCGGTIQDGYCDTVGVGHGPFPGGPAERKKCGFTAGLEGRSARRADLMANAIRPRTLT